VLPLCTLLNSLIVRSFYDFEIPKNITPESVDIKTAGRMLLFEYLFTVVMCFGITLKQVAAIINIDCGTRGLDVEFQSERRELRCVCASKSDESFEEEYFSEIINPQLAQLSSFARPVSKTISHIILSNCKKLKIILDLDRVDSDASELTDISLEYIENLSVKFRNIVQPRMRFVFTNIMFNQLTGSISGRSNTIEMFFRQFNRADRDQTSVTFRNIDIQANIRLMNFQDIGHVRVVDSNFAKIDTLDLIPLQNIKCHTSLESYRGSEVTCSKEELFFASRYSSTRRTNPPPYNRVTDRRPRFEDTTNNFYNTERTRKPYSPFYRTLTTSTFNATASPYAAPVTSSPLFIVPMVLFFAVALIVVLVLLFIRYQKRQDSMVELLR